MSSFILILWVSWGTHGSTAIESIRFPNEMSCLNAGKLFDQKWRSMDNRWLRVPEDVSKTARSNYE